MNQKKNTRENPWEWIIAMLVGVIVTLLCVAQQVQPLTIVIRVGIAVCCVAMVIKITAVSVKQLAPSKSK